MEFSVFFNKFIKLKDFDKNDATYILSSYKDHCTTEDDFIQLNEIQNILDVVSIFYELNKAYNSCSSDFQPLFDKIENLSKRLEEENISCCSYAYYIWVFLNFLFNNSTDISKSNTLDKIDWNDPKKFNYSKPLYEITFGVSGNTMSKAFPDYKKFQCENGRLVSYTGSKPYVIIPDFVKCISRCAFSGNTKIKMVYLPDSVECIEDGAFENCSKLNLIHLSEKIQSIGNDCFKNCKNLKFINGENITFVGNHAFEKCNQLSNVDLVSLKNVGDYAFSGCNNFKESDFDFISNLSSIGNYSFQGCKIKEICINECSYLGDFAFKGCNSINKITINKSIGKLGKTPFFRCIYVTSVILNFAPDFKILDLFESNEKDYENTVYKLEKVKLVTLTKGICSNLNTLLFADVEGKTEIPNCAFKNCSNLIGINFIKNKINEIGDYAFAKCSNLSELRINYTGDALGEAAFYKCSKMKNFDFLNNVSVFKNKCLAYTNLTDFDFFKRDFKYVGAFAFANSYFPNEINIKLNGTHISLGAFHGVKTINFIFVKNINLSGNKFYLLFEKKYDDFVRNVKISKLISDFVAMDSMFENYNSRYIECNLNNINVPDKLFFNCKNLETVKLNSSVGIFGKSCFENCSNLQYINAEFNDNLYVGDSAFKNCLKFEYNLFNKTYYIGNNAFNSSFVKHLSLGKNIQHIGKFAFGNCDISDNVTLPFIGTDDSNNNMPFGIIFSDSKCDNTEVQSLSDSENYYIPPSIKNISVLSDKIGSQAFKNCPFLKTIELRNIKTLSESCFASCKSLERISFGGALQEFDALALFGTSKNLEINISKDNKYFSIRNGSIYSFDGKTIFYAKPGMSLDLEGVSIIKKHAISSYSGNELTLNRVELIEHDSIDISAVKKLNIIDVKNIEDRAFRRGQLDELNISSVNSNEYGNPFTDYRGTRLNKFCLNGVLVSSITKLFGLTNCIRISMLSLNNTYISNGFFDNTKIERIVCENLSGKSTLNYPVGSIYLIDSDPISKLFGGNINANKILIKTKDIKENDLGSLYASQLDLNVSGTIFNKSMDGIIVDDTLILSNVSFIENKALIKAHFKNICTNNSKYKSRDNSIYIGDTLFYFKPRKKIFRIPINILNIGEFSVDLTDVEDLSVANENISIANKAFYNCGKLRKLSIGRIKCEKASALFESVDGIETIEYLGNIIPRKFLSGFIGTKFISLPIGIKKISDFAFAHNPKLESISNFENSYYYGDYVLDGCSSISKIEFNSTAEYIGFGCLENCESLKDVVLPIPKNHISGLITFKEAICSNNDMKILVVKGNIPAHYFENSNCKITIAYAPLQIDEFAFANCKHLTIDLSKAKEVGDYSFKNSSIIDCNLVECENIGEQAFMDCSNLENLILSPDLLEIGEKAFSGCSISTIKMPGTGKVYNVFNNSICKGPNLFFYAPYAKSDTLNLNGFNITTVMPFAFNNCKSLRKFIGTGIKRFSHDSFSNCDNLSFVDVSSENSIVEKNVFHNCNNIDTLKIRRIHTDLVNNLSDLFISEDINQIPNSLKKLIITGKEISTADLQCKNSISNVVLNEAVVLIPDGYFSKCKCLESFIAPRKCARIGAQAFKNCTGLIEYTDSAVTEYGDNCFENSSIKEFAVKSNVKILGKDILKNCNKLQTLIIDIKLNDFKLQIMGLQPKTSSIKKVNIPRIEKLSESAFAGFAELESVELYSGLKEIPADCFENSGLSSISLPNSVKIIGDRAFYNTMLKTIDFSCIEKIGSLAFAFSNLNKLDVPSDLVFLGEKAFEKCPVRELKYSYPKFDFSVEKLGIDPNSLSEVEINKTGLSIGAFSNCCNLKNVALKRKGEEIPDKAFANCTKLTKFSALKVPKIGKYAFSNCRSLSIDESLFDDTKIIGAFAFQNCEKIGKINLPSVVDLGINAFAGCKKMTLGSLNDNLKVIPKECFMNTSIGEFKLPSKLERIENYAFANTDITNLDIPNNIQYIGSMIFKGNPKNVKLFLNPSCDKSKWASDWNEGLAFKHNVLKFLNPKVKVVNKSNK